ncbi:unnamed protein product [Darwinula stevensoni]|uniref:Uncharacterized protein n=1 Tax=Darwinula stevensoni TaxID=69355 RepID=A0A7R8XE72_9CRUS|nr:unnamed protein product [Darwinula stevensoni]CAG0894186.1 unnamed protein product [Darwinula stevensoni]
MYDNRNLTDLPPGLFDSMENLESFNCDYCGLGPTLRAGSLAFSSPTLTHVRLAENDFVSLEPGAISGER